MTVKDYKRKSGQTTKASIKDSKYLKGLFKRVLITTILVMSILILCNTSKKINAFTNKYLFEAHFNFSYLNNIYDKALIALKPDNTVKVSNEEPLDYEEYKDGVKVRLEDSNAVKLRDSGIVVFIGEKDDYGNVVIIQQSNGIDAWYGNIIKTDLKLYDYAEKNTILGEGKDNYYLVFQKNGEFLNYKEYIK